MLAEQKAEQEALLNERFEDLIQRQKDAESGQTAAREAAIAKLDELQNQARERGLTDLADRLSQAREAGFDELENLTREAREQGLGDLEAALTEAQQAGQAQLTQAQEASEARQISAREAALAELRREVGQETASAAAAQAAERSEVVKALEERLAGVKESLQAESERLKAQGIEERANIKAEQQNLVDTLQSNIDKARDELAESQQKVKEAQDQAIGSLEDRQTSLIDDVKSRISDLGSTLTDTKQEINQELDRRDEQLTGSQKAAAEAIQGEIDSVRNDLVTIQGDIETETKAQTDALRMERETLLGNIENSVEVLKGNIEGLPIEEIQARLDSLKTEADDFVGTASEQRKDLFQKIEALKDGQISQGQVYESIQNALRDGTLSPDQINSALDNLRSELGEARAADIENLRTVTETGRADLSSQISALNNALEGRASAEDLQLLEKALGEQAAGLGAAGEERAELIRQIGLLEEQGITQEDLAAALEGRASLDDIQALRDALEGRVTAEDFQKDRERQDFFLKSFEDALKQTAKESTRSSEAIKALQAAQLDPAQIEQQRMAAITGAVDPIQAQIEKLRGEIPQQIDVEALRKQITQEVLAGMPQPVTNVQAPAVSVGPGTGGMDPYGQGGGYSTLPTTEGAAEMMGARPDYSAALNMSDGMADAMGFIPGGSLEDQIAFADVQPTTTVQPATTMQPATTVQPATTAPTNLIERPDTTGMGVMLDKPVNVAIQKPAVVSPVKRPVMAFSPLGFNKRRIR
jgi:hypothetical protein